MKHQTSPMLRTWLCNMMVLSIEEMYKNLELSMTAETETTGMQCP